LYLGELEDLDGDGFLRELVEALEDFGAEAAANYLERVVDVVLDLLHHLLLLLNDHLTNFIRNIGMNKRRGKTSYHSNQGMNC
jgi:hypothetical protein